jgi:hypothetical protein
MKQILLIASFIFAFAFSTKAQTVIYSEDFEGASPTFQLNTADLSGVSGSENYWTINNAYTGGSFDFDCPIVGTQNITLTNTPNQPGAIVNSPLSNYLHITCGQAEAQGISNCAFIAANTVCPPVESYFAKMTTNINTAGQSNVNLSFWWLCQGSADNYGEVYYSIDGGNTWVLENNGSTSQFQGSSNWVFESISNPDYNNQPNLLFAFRFMNGVSFTAQDPAFGVDDIQVTSEPATGNTITTGNPTAGPYCPGETITIPYSVSGTFNAGNVFTAQLSNAAGSFAAPIAIGTNPGTGNGVIIATIPLGTAPGVGYLVRVISNSPNTNGSASTTTIEVSGSPTAAVSNASSTTVCANGIATLTYSGSNGAVQWSSSNAIGGPFNPIVGATSLTYVSGPLAQTTYYRVTVTTNCGTATSITWTVSLTNVVTIPLISAPNTLNLCNGPVTVSTIGTFTGLTWSNGQSGTSAIVVSTPGTVTVTGNDISGCPAESAPLTFIQTTPPTLDVTPPSPLTICGANAQLTASAGFTTYTWSGPTASLTGNPITVTGPGSVQLTALDGNGCVVTFGPIQAVTGTGVPVPVSPSIAAICDGEPATITAGGGFTNYLWNNGATGQSITVTQTGYYNVESALDANGCPGQSALVEVIESQFPVPNFNYVQTPGGYTIEFENNSQNGLNFYWSFDSLGVSPIKDPTFTFPDSGPYYITLYVSNPCDTDSVTKLIIVAQVGYEDLQQELGIAVYPNPSNSNFNVNVQKMNQEAVNIKLYDMAGRFIMTKSLNILSDTNFIIEGNLLEKGVYFLQLDRGNKSSSIKLIKTE